MNATTVEKRERSAVPVFPSPGEVTPADERAFLEVISTSLTPEQAARVTTPPETYPKQEAVLAVHWHPEFIPINLILQRVNAAFPNRTHELIIPTQHNELVTLDGYTGVEIDCYSTGFNLKVQLLAHFAAEKLQSADVLRSMLEHTFKYRASQLYEFIDSIVEPKFADRVVRAAANTGAPEELVRFVRAHVGKIRQLIERHEKDMPVSYLKNKLIRNYFDAIRTNANDDVIDHAQVFIHAVKRIVKAHFNFGYFYQTEQIIEEVRGLGGGIVVPHPEQFWPILLADYDVDGIEVWNPQSQQYTDFLIKVVHEQNKSRRRGQRRLLTFMGDDTHFGEKVRDPKYLDSEKAGRELGVQPAWDDLDICKSLIVANIDRKSLIEEYKTRLG